MFTRLKGKVLPTICIEDDLVFQSIIPQYEEFIDALAAHAGSAELRGRLFRCATRVLISTRSRRIWTRPVPVKTHAGTSFPDSKRMNHCLHIEITHKGKACLPCVYMDEAVLDVLPAYDRQVTYSKLDIRSEEGKRRFLSLSCALFGEKGVYAHHRLAPVPACSSMANSCSTQFLRGMNLRRRLRNS